MKHKILKGICSMIMIVFLLMHALMIVGCKRKDEKGADKSVLLISIDGMRPDAIHNTEYGKYLETVCSYTLNAQTIYPSITLPCHMSMFHSVEPSQHGVVENKYTPNPDMGNGIVETLLVADKKTAIFYNWQLIDNVAKPNESVHLKFIDPAPIGWEEANKQTAEACIDYLNNNEVDFTFLYLGFLDEAGHEFGWLSNEYYYALNQSLSLVQQVISVLTKDYTVIITTDHGGSSYGHGSSSSDDMTIPVFVMGSGFEKGKIHDGGSILDIAPTILKIIGVETPVYWKGKALFMSN